MTCPFSFRRRDRHHPRRKNSADSLRAAFGHGASGGGWTSFIRSIRGSQNTLSEEGSEDDPEHGCCYASDDLSGDEANRGRRHRRQRRVSVVMDDFIKSSSGIMQRQFSHTNESDSNAENTDAGGGVSDCGGGGVGDDDIITEDREGEMREQEEKEGKSKKRLIRQSEVEEKTQQQQQS